MTTLVGPLKSSRAKPAFTFLSLILVAVILSTSGCSLFGSKKKGGSGSDAADMGEADLNADRDSRFGRNSIPTAEGEGMFRDIPFGYDSYDISSDARNDIESNAQVLESNAGLKIVLEGHTDGRGTEEYNLALGQARAKAVKDSLSSLGVSASRIDTISYGENVPLELGENESAFAKNRRVHFSALGNKGS